MNDWTQWERTYNGMFDKQVTLIQHKSGYRFNEDSVLLSCFVSRGKVGRVLDLGTGCGIIPILLAHLWRHQPNPPKMIGLERQESLASLALLNVEKNGLRQQISITRGDLRDMKALSFSPEILTFNPPYFVSGEGKLSANPERAAARHELHGSLEELLASIVQWMGKGSSLFLVYPMTRWERLKNAIHTHSLHLQRVQCVHPFPEHPPRLILLETGFTKNTVRIEAPLTLQVVPGTHTPEAQKLFAGLLDVKP